MMSSLLSRTTTRCSNSKHVILSNVGSRSYWGKFLFPTTSAYWSGWTLLPVACTFLMVWTDYRGHFAWMHGSRRCLDYRQGIPIRQSPYRTHRTVREDHHWTLAIQRQQKPEEPSFLTVIRAEKGKVVGYINKLENYNAGEIAKIATDHGLYEEALMIYKYDQHVMAINVLVEHIVSIDRGFDYANKVNRPEVWSRLAKAQLDGLRIKDSIGTQYFALSLNLEHTFLFFWQTRTSRLKIRPTSLKSSKSRSCRKA